MTADEFKNLIYPYRDRLYRLAYRMLGQQAEAEDVIQDVFLKLWKLGPELSEKDKPEAFCYALTRNKCLDVIKLRKHSSELDEGLSVPQTDPVEQAETRNHINRAMAQLNEMQKTIMHMRDIEGFSFDEISEVLEINHNNIRVNLSRARKKIRDELVKMNVYESGH